MNDNNIRILYLGWLFLLGGMLIGIAMVRLQFPLEKQNLYPQLEPRPAYQAEDCYTKGEGNGYNEIVLLALQEGSEVLYWDDMTVVIQFYNGFIIRYDLVQFRGQYRDYMYWCKRPIEGI